MSDVFPFPCRDETRLPDIIAMLRFANAKRQITGAYKKLNRQLNLVAPSIISTVRAMGVIAVIVRLAVFEVSCSSSIIN